MNWKMKLGFIIILLTALPSCSRILQETWGRSYIKHSQNIGQFQSKTKQFADFNLVSSSNLPIMELPQNGDTLRLLIAYGHYTEFTEKAADQLGGELDYDFHQNYIDKEGKSGFKVRYLFPQLNIGTFSFCNVKINYTEPFIMDNIELDGIIGVDFLKYFTVVLDNKTKRIDFFQNNNLYKKETSQIYASKLKKHWNQIYAIQVTGNHFKEWAEIYTRLNTRILLNKKPFKNYRPVACISENIGTHGSYNYPTYSIEDAMIGSHSIDDLLVSSWEYKSLIGYDFFKNQKVIFDLPQEKIYLDPANSIQTSRDSSAYDALKLSISMKNGHFTIDKVSCELHEIDNINPLDKCIKINGISLEKIKTIKELNSFFEQLKKKNINTIILTLKQGDTEIEKEIKAYHTYSKYHNSIMLY